MVGEKGRLISLFPDRMMVGEKRAFNFPILFTARLFCRICQQPTKRLAERACGSFSRKIDNEDEKMSEYLIFRLKSIGQRSVVGSFLVAGALGTVGPATAWAADAGPPNAVPFEFVGTAANCGIAGSRIVTAEWLRGIGRADNDVPNDPHNRLLLSKNGATADCSSAGASIKGVKGMVVTDTFEVGFDYRNGGHCGAGAPRFNIDTDQGVFFVGCANAPTKPAPHDPEWPRISSALTAC